MSDGLPERRVVERVAYERQELDRGGFYVIVEASEETEVIHRGDWQDHAPYVPYTGRSIRSIVLCEETGRTAGKDGACPVHGGDACLYTYKHPYDNEVDRWKKAAEWRPERSHR